MNISLPFGHKLHGDLEPVLQQFRRMKAQIVKGWNIQHTPEGAHRAITAESLSCNQGTEDGEIASWQSDDVNHGVSRLTNTKTFGYLKKNSSANAGVQLCGVSAATEAVALIGTATTANTTKTASAVAPVAFVAQLKNGTTTQAMSANGNLATIGDGAGVRWLVDTEGDTYRDGTDNTYDAYDDPMLALAFEHAMNPGARVSALFNEYCRYNEDTLERAGIVAEIDPVTRRRFYNESALLRLVTGAVWQLAIENRQMRQQLTALEAR